MKFTTVAAALGLLALSACGSPQFEEGFNQAFDKSTKESCVKSAQKAGAPAERIEPYCTCFVGQLSGLSVQDKMKLTPNSPQITAAANTCLAQSQGVGPRQPPPNP